MEKKEEIKYKGNTGKKNKKIKIKRIRKRAQEKR